MQTRNRPTIKLRGGPHGIPRPIVEEVQRERLRSAVLEVVAAESYRATTVHKVLAAAHISRRTFYELFADLHDCYLAAYVQATRDAAELVADACGGGATPGAKVEAGLTALLELCAREPALAKACVVEVLAAGPTARDRRTELMERLAGLLAEQIQAAEVGDPETAHLRARVLVGGVHELIYDRVTRGRAAELPTLVPEIVASQLSLPATEAPHGA